MARKRASPSNVHDGASVLVFYGGKGKKYADGLVQNLRTLGCDAAVVASLPSPPGGIADKFEHYFGRAHFFVAVVTAEHRTGGHNLPKAEILPELTRCLTDRPDDTLVLLEKGTELPSTLPHTVYETFEKSSFYDVLRKVYDRLIPKKVLRVLSPGRVTKRQPARKSALAADTRTVLAAFLNETQRLWTWLDMTWETVEDKDLLVAKHVTERLDEFAQEYYYALLGIVNEQDDRALQKHLKACLRRCNNAVTGLMENVLRELKTEAHRVPSVARRDTPADREVREWLSRGDQDYERFSRAAETADKVAAFKDSANCYKRVLLSAGK